MCGTEGAAALLHDVRDDAENSEADIQDDIEFALLQMKAETLEKITQALERLDEGTFGYCYECGKEISSGRLRGVALRGALHGLRGDPGGRTRARGACRPAGSGIIVSRSRGLTNIPAVPGPDWQRDSARRPGMTEEASHPDASATPSGEGELSVPAELPILPLRDTVLFPSSFMPLAVAREGSVRLIQGGCRR